MKKGVISIILFLCCVYQSNGQSCDFDKFEAYMYKNELMSHYGRHYLDSIKSYATSNYHKDLKHVHKLSKLRNLIIDDSFVYIGDGGCIKAIKNRIFKKKLPIPTSVKCVTINGFVSIPLPIDLSKHKQILEELYLEEVYVGDKSDSAFLDLSDFVNLKHISIFRRNASSSKCYVKLPPNLISYKGYMNDSYEKYDSLPKTIEYLQISIDSTFPKQIFELKNLKKLTIHNLDFLKNDFLAFTSLKILSIDNFTNKDVEVLSKMNLDTLYWTNNESIYPDKNFSDIANGIPTELDSINVKCIVVSGFGYRTPDGGGADVVLIASMIKSRFPTIKVYYIDSINLPMKEAHERN